MTVLNSAAKLTGLPVSGSVRVPRRARSRTSDVGLRGAPAVERAIGRHVAPLGELREVLLEGTRPGAHQVPRGTHVQVVHVPVADEGADAVREHLRVQLHGQGSVGVPDLGDLLLTECRPDSVDVAHCLTCVRVVVQRAGEASAVLTQLPLRRHQRIEVGLAVRIFHRLDAVGLGLVAGDRAAGVDAARVVGHDVEALAHRVGEHLALPEDHVGDARGAGPARIHDGRTDALARVLGLDARHTDVDLLAARIVPVQRDFEGPALDRVGGVRAVPPVDGADVRRYVDLPLVVRGRIGVGGNEVRHKCGQCRGRRHHRPAGTDPRSSPRCPVRGAARAGPGLGRVIQHALLKCESVVRPWPGSQGRRFPLVTKNVDRLFTAQPEQDGVLSAAPKRAPQGVAR